jgi:hypothetical protein
VVIVDAQVDRGDCHDYLAGDSVGAAFVLLVSVCQVKSRFQRKLKTAFLQALSA